MSKLTLVEAGTFGFGEDDIIATVIIDNIMVDVSFFIGDDGDYTMSDSVYEHGLGNDMACLLREGVYERSEEGRQLVERITSVVLSNFQ